MALKLAPPGAFLAFHSAIVQKCNISSDILGFPFPKYILLWSRVSIVKVGSLLLRNGKFSYCNFSNWSRDRL